MVYISQFEASDIDSDDIDLRFEVDGVETGTTVSIVDECGHAAQIITALLDELEHYKSREERVTKLVLDNSTSWDALYKKLEAAEKRIAEQREYYEGVIADGSKRIAELERSETQLINERDSAESALNNAYKAVMGQAPEWSNWFSFENAIDEIELVCELWRNQTDDVIQFRQRIQELEARQIALPQRLSPEGYHIDEAYMVDDDEGEYLDRDAVIEAIRAAGIKVKGE
ncbi:ead/Ea22-like family protein [Salmonella enterica subsp. enterica]|nr:ead/Ea22-like family protein [Salmonella enterica subsp. enterica]